MFVSGVGSPRGGSRALAGRVARRDHHTAAVGRAPQKIVAGNAVVSCGTDKKIQSTLPDALLIMREQSLRDAQIRGCLLLAIAPFLPQQGQDPWEIVVHHNGTPRCRREFYRVKTRWLWNLLRNKSGI